MDPVKPGWKTTEFWVTVVAQILGIMALSGVITPEASGEMAGAVEQVTGGVMVLISQISYAIARAKAKGDDVQARALIKR